MKPEQKDLIMSLFVAMKKADDIFDDCIQISTEETKENGWEIIIEEKLVEGIPAFVFFVEIANTINTCLQIYSAQNELLIYGIEPIDRNGGLILRYAIF